MPHLAETFLGTFLVSLTFNLRTLIVRAKIFLITSSDMPLNLTQWRMIMHVKLALLTFFIVLSLMLGNTSKLPAQDGNGSPSDPVLELPVRFHLLSDITMQKAGVEMGMWVTAEDVTNHIVPEMNRIWEPAGIRWVVESILIEQSADIANKQDVIERIQDSDRSTSTLTSEVRSLFPADATHEAIINLHLFPFIGGTRQGFAATGGGWESGIPNDGGNIAYVGVWTDKPSGGRNPPFQFPLTEALPFTIGSIARTCAHEVGHNLRLGHPNTSTQSVFNRLMGGIRDGYDLVEDEISSSRSVAERRLDAIARYNSLFPPVLLGDANGDRVVDNFDIVGFAMALFNRPMYVAMYPDSEPEVVLDMNDDGEFNNFDIAGFATALGF